MSSKTYRALTRIHIGGTEPPAHLSKGDVVQFDGSTLKRGDTEIPLQNPGAMESAIKVGWLVPETSSETDFQPQPAGVEVRAAQSTGRDRAKVEVMTVADEERDMGHLSDIRPDAAPDVHVAKNAGEVSTVKVSKGAATGAKVAREGDDGKVVGKIGTPTNFGTLEVGKDDLKAKSKLDSNKVIPIEKVAQATGDVQEVRTGDTLEELLPDAASAGTPEPGTFKNDGVEVGNSGSSTGGAEQGVEVAKVGQGKTPRKAPTNPEAALRHWAETGETWDGQPVSLNEVRVLARQVFRKIDAGSTPDLPDIDDLLETVLGTSNSIKEKVVAEVDPQNNQWDTTAHWKTRCGWAKSLDRGGLEAVLKLDPSKGVRKFVKGLLASQA